MTHPGFTAPIWATHKVAPAAEWASLKMEFEGLGVSLISATLSTNLATGFEKWRLQGGDRSELERLQGLMSAAAELVLPDPVWSAWLDLVCRTGMDGNVPHSGSDSVWGNPPEPTETRIIPDVVAASVRLIQHFPKKANKAKSLARGGDVVRDITLLVAHPERIDPSGVARTICGWMSVGGLSRLIDDGVERPTAAAPKGEEDLIEEIAFSLYGLSRVVIGQFYLSEPVALEVLGALRRSITSYAWALPRRMPPSLTYGQYIERLNKLLSGPAMTLDDLSRHPKCGVPGDWNLWAWIAEYLGASMGTTLLYAGPPAATTDTKSALNKRTYTKLDEQVYRLIPRGSFYDHDNQSLIRTLLAQIRIGIRRPKWSHEAFRACLNRIRWHHRMPASADVKMNLRVVGERKTVTKRSTTGQ